MINMNIGQCTATGQAPVAHKALGGGGGPRRHRAPRAARPRERSCAGSASGALGKLGHARSSPG